MPAASHTASPSAYDSVQMNKTAELFSDAITIIILGTSGTPSQRTEYNSSWGRVADLVRWQKLGSIKVFHAALQGCNKTQIFDINSPRPNSEQAFFHNSNRQPERFSAICKPYVDPLVQSEPKAFVYFSSLLRYPRATTPSIPPTLSLTFLNFPLHKPFPLGKDNYQGRVYIISFN